MTVSPFKADCEACYGLCCVALSFDRSDHFGHDKVAGEPCHHLDTAFRCRIHGRREELGYEGCEAFDCLGAGQRATALHPNGSWRSDPAHAGQLYADFSVLMRLQEMRQALVTAETLALSDELEQERRVLLNEFEHCADDGEAGMAGRSKTMLEHASAFMRKLRDVV